jgi:predicted nuclease of predicted toxin-antitoxin system
MRFHLDQHVAHAIAEGLRRRGVDVTTTADAGLLDAPDEAHVAFALREHRVIVTQDADFLRLDAADVEHAGIVYARQGSRSVGEMVRFLALMDQCLEEAEFYGRVDYL